MKWFKGRFKYAWSGLRYALEDRSIAWQIFFGLVVIIAGIVLGLTTTEWIVVLLCVTLVIVLEIINSCLEHLVDYISLERTPQAKQIKDMAAGAVFLVSLFSALMGCIVFVPKIVHLLVH